MVDGTVDQMDDSRAAEMVDEMADYSAGLTAEIRVVLMVSLRAVASEAEKVEKKGDTLVQLLVASMVSLLEMRMVVVTVPLSVVQTDWSVCWMVDTMEAWSREK